MRENFPSIYFHFVNIKLRMIINTMYTHKRALLNLATSFSPRRWNNHFDNKYVVCFSSISDSDKGGTTRPGSEGYSGSGISDAGNAAAEGLHGGWQGGVGDLGRGNKAFDGGEQRRREQMNRGDSARDTANYAAEMARAGVVVAIETGLKLGEMAKQTVDGLWDATKKTTESVRDSVAAGGSADRNNNRFDDSNYNRKDDINDTNNIDQSKQTSDKHVEDLRRLARGYDLKDH